MFKDRAILRQALTHVSASPVSYQRLEFLGDRVLGLAIAEMLYKAFPEETEGELSRRLSELVRRETCAEVAIAWDVGVHLHLGKSEAHSGGRRKETILADVCEAIIGACFQDGGWEAARDLVERAFGPRLNASAAPARDPKTTLQEWAQGRGLRTPAYVSLERTGPDHRPVFRIGVRVTGLTEAIGEGLSKRAAEQDAARRLLLREGVWQENEHAEGKGAAGGQDVG